MRVQFQEEKMHTKDAIKFALTVSNGAVLSVIDEMRGAATTFPTPNGGGRPPGGGGDLEPGEGVSPAAPFRGKNPPAEWQPVFRWGDEPRPQAQRGFPL